MIHQYAASKLFRKLDTIEHGTIKVVTPDGHTRVFQGKTPGDEAMLELYDWSVITNIARKGDVGFAEDYRAGRWNTDNLTSLVTLGLINKKALDDYVIGGRAARLLSMFSYLFRANTLKGSKRNIHEHYDLGNDFYRLWLDPSMTYSSALYRAANEALEQAQHNKYDRIIHHLDASSGSILEVGCGWGGFAERALNKGDYGIKGITLSEEQHDYAQKRLKGSADIVLEDYRAQDSKFDRIVSIEMFEAVGEQYWPTYFQKLASLLKNKGKAVVQTITINEEDFPRYRKGGDFVRSLIFPGGMLPSLSRFEEEARRAGLKMHKPFFFGQHYARTLSAWLDTFDEKRPEVEALGFDEGFIRLWRFYLAACAAGFQTGRTDVMQVELSHA